MPEADELFNNNPAYNSPTFVSEWLNISSSNSLYIIVFSSSAYTCTIDYTIDDQYQIISTESTFSEANTSKEFVLYAKTRFLRLTVSGLTNPCILRTQGWFHTTNVISKFQDDAVISAEIADLGLTKNAYGSLQTESLTPLKQYSFSHGTSGTALTAVVPFDDATIYDSGINGQVVFVSGVLQLTGVQTGELIYLAGSSVVYRPSQTTIARYSAAMTQGPKDPSGLGCTRQIVGIGNTLLNAVNCFIGVGFYDDTLPYHPDSFGCVWLRNGVLQSFVTRQNFNRDKMDGTGKSGILINDWTKLILFEITAQLTGNISFYAEDPVKGDFVLFHVFENSGTRNDSNFADPNMGFIQYQELTPLSVPLGPDFNCVGEVGIFLQGLEAQPSTRGAGFSPKIGITADENILTIRCDETFLGMKNYRPIRLDNITVASDGNKSVTCCLFKDPILVGPVYTPTNPNIPASADKVGVYGGPGANGLLIMVISLAKIDNAIVDLSPYNIIINPGEYITATATSALSSDVNVGMSFYG
jgi:hypothetical protein